MGCSPRPPATPVISTDVSTIDNSNLEMISNGINVQSEPVSKKASIWYSPVLFSQSSGATLILIIGAEGKPLPTFTYSNFCAYSSPTE